MIRKKRWFAVVYMFVVTAFFSTIVIGLAQFTREDVEANQALAFERAVVDVLPGLYEPGLSRMEIHARFVADVCQPDGSSGGAYTIRDGPRIVAYALPFEGQGFWSPIKGVIGVMANHKSVTGISFYEQSETPGLGAEIATAAFTGQFKDKTLAAGERAMRFRRPGDSLGAGDVHAVTGATQTSNRVEKIINDAIVQWRAETAGK